ncbi:MAG: DNA primase, partial [Candidatus Saccharimonas sp.]
MDAKEEVRARLNIEDVIGEYVQLKRAGRSFKGLSPFTSEKTPSFFVSPDKNIWHDFSSNKGGDVFAFVMEAEGMDFRQALEFLAKKAGVELSDYEPAHAKEHAARKKRLLIANQLAARFYQQCLLHNQHAMEYVFRVRSLSKQVVADFQIGYAPDSGEALVRALDKKGFSRRELNDAGLLNRFGGDMFRGRMMVPLMDSSGQVIGFTGRIIGDVPNAPKYLNTPQTLLYDKGRHIFALSQAKQAIRQAGFIVMVEGNLDVVSSHQAGIKNVVATAGTAMTEQHIRAVKRLTGDVRLAYDGDKAGVAATERAITLASQAGVELTIISLPEQYKDPDELIQADVSLWQRAIDTAEPAVDWILRQYA